MSIKIRVLFKFGDIGGIAESKIAFLTKKAMEVKRWEGEVMSLLRRKQTLPI